MILYHLDRWKYRDVWPPEGTLYAEGRWNQPGQWIIYCSSSIALAKLEILANENHLPIKRVCMTIEVDETGGIFDVGQQLPPNWMNKPYPAGLSHLTAQFLRSGNLLMKVPSAQSYRESNYLLNARHADFHKLVRLVSVLEEPFDSRLK